MKFISLIFVVAFIAATGSLLGAMSTVASAQPSASDALANTATLGLADASATRLTGSLPRPFAATVTPADTAAKPAKKRARNRCARITGTCWDRP